LYLQMNSGIQLNRTLVRENCLDSRNVM